jgi:hypothetical protein
MKKNFTLLAILIILTIITGVAWFMNKDGGSLGEVLADYVIEDTASVSRIYIADTDNNSVNLVKDPITGKWTCNDKFAAREDAVRLLLKTFKRIAVKAPVPQPTQPTVISMIAGRGLRVDIYQQDQLAKTYMIGTCTQDHFGTYMVLEMPDGQRSSEPLVMHMEGFTGCLKQRFFTNEEEWRHTGVFSYPNLEFSKVEMINHENPTESFAVTYGGGNDIKLQSKLLGTDIAHFDTLLVKDYLIRFKKVHCETFESHLTDQGEDSLLNSLPAYTIRVTENSGTVKKIDLYHKKPAQAQVDLEGKLMPWDGDRMYGRIDKDEVVLVQLFTFQSLIQGISHFRP